MKTLSDNDKTRIDAAKAAKQKAAEDKTRVAERSVADDKTRIAAKKAQADKTRIANKKTASVSQGAANSKTVDDKTRIALKKKAALAAAQGGDKTRIGKPRSDSAVAGDRTVVAKGNRSNVARPRPTAGEPNRNPNSSASTHTGTNRELLKNRFVLEKILGAGGMGVVYKAKDLLKIEAQDRDPYVAIKVLSEEFRTHPEAFIALQRESRKSQRIAHPNIVNVHDFDKDGDTVYMTMEFLDGQPLDKLIRQYKETGLPEEQVFEILEDISAALVYAHKHNVIHADFKPGNIFVVKNGTAKVFDFGIARAVAKAEKHGNVEHDKTVFDAGNLGALTPAYASMEMLEGEPPDYRDDVYALGCIAYELHTGEHPFRRINANEAYRKKLKPARIMGISKNKWKAIEQALAFERDNRIESISEFWSLYSRKKSHTVKLSLVASFVLLLTGAGVFQFFNSAAPVSTVNTEDVRNELEYEIRLELAKANIAALIDSTLFTPPWEESLWTEIQDVSTMLEPSDVWLGETRHTIFGLYVGQIDKAINEEELDHAQNLIGNAARYSAEPDQLGPYQTALAKAFDIQAERIAREERERAKQQQEQQRRTEVAEKEAEKRSQFDVAYNNVRELLSCGGKVDMRDMEIAVDKLRSVDMSRYRRIEDDIVKPLSSCISEIGVAFPERAKEIKRQAMRLFEANLVIANTRIIPRDPCDPSLAGLGSSGKRAICRDKIAGVGNGPALVVIPARGSIPNFAIGKYEVTIDEINDFCKLSESCSEFQSNSRDLPVTNISIDLVNAYVNWLSNKTDKTYRLPSGAEWNYAAMANSRSLDPNRNCILSTRGIQKGGTLLKASVGAQNKWGLVNHLGNAGEWVSDKGGKLLVVGGTYLTPMESCTFQNTMNHDGRADSTIGFRVLREIQTRN